MEVGTLAGVITALTGMITAVGGLILAIKVWLPTHKIVNQQRTDMINFQTVLINTLTAHGIDVPEDQSRVQPK
jgi:hypothetical protein